ncbi:MAG: response regulator [Acidobacteriota bacterium]
MADAPGTGRRILVADDEESVRFVAQRILERSGFDVTLAADGPETVTAVQSSGPFDLLLLDVNMPGMSCEETVTAALDAAPELPIVLCSGLTGEEAELRTARSLTRGFLQKPFRFQELLDAIESAAG